MEGAAIFGTVRASWQLCLACERSSRELQKCLMLLERLAHLAGFMKGAMEREGTSLPITVASVCKGIGPGGCRDTQAPSGHWHSCWCLQGWLWIMSFSDQRPAFWIQAWRDINSLRFCPNGSYSHRILRASEELQIVAPHGEITPPIYQPVGYYLILSSSCLGQRGLVLSRMDLYFFWF